MQSNSAATLQVIGRIYGFRSAALTRLRLAYTARRRCAGYATDYSENLRNKASLQTAEMWGSFAYCER